MDGKLKPYGMHETPRQEPSGSNLGGAAVRYPSLHTPPNATSSESGEQNPPPTAPIVNRCKDVFDKSIVKK